MSILDKVMRIIRQVEEEYVAEDVFDEDEMIGVESRLDSLHLYHLNALKPQNDPQE